MSTDESEYWQARREREDAEYEYRQRRRKTLPWNIAAGVILALGVIYVLLQLAA